MSAIVDLTSKGGYVMVPLYITAMVCLYFIIERSLALWKFRQREQAFLKDVREIGLMAAAARADNFGPAQVIATGRGVDATLAELTMVLEHDLGRFLHGLAAIYKGSPLLGLLGATLGIIKVFRKLSVQGLEQMEYFAGGISEVLVTTATGLLIAIPALFFTFYLNGLLARKISEYETLYLSEIEKGR